MKNSFEFKNEVERQIFIEDKYVTLETQPVKIFSWLAFPSVFIVLIIAIVTAVFDIDSIRDFSNRFFWLYVATTFIIPTIVVVIYAVKLVKTINAAKSIELNDLEYKETLTSNLKRSKELLVQIEEWEKELKDIESYGKLINMMNELNFSVDQMSKEGPVLLKLKTNFINYFEYVSKKLRLQEMEVRAIDRRILRLRIEVAIDEAEVILSELK